MQHKTGLERSLLVTVSNLRYRLELERVSTFRACAFSVVVSIIAISETFYIVLRSF
jgi:hypothetical protein